MRGIFNIVSNDCITFQVKKKLLEFAKDDSDEDCAVTLRG